MKVVVNRDNCIGCGACEVVCGKVFQIDDEGISKVICENFDEVDQNELTEAIEGCPTSAIQKVEAEDAEANDIEEEKAA